MLSEQEVMILLIFHDFPYSLGFARESNFCKGVFGEALNFLATILKEEKHIDYFDAMY